MTPQELKSSILQLAIQGKLVEHSENEEGVSVRSSYSGEILDLFEIPEVNGSGFDEVEIVRD